MCHSASEYTAVHTITMYILRLKHTLSSIFNMYGVHGSYVCVWCMTTERESYPAKMAPSADTCHWTELEPAITTAVNGSTPSWRKTTIFSGFFIGICAVLHIIRTCLQAWFIRDH